MDNNFLSVTCWKRAQLLSSWISPTSESILQGHVLQTSHIGTQLIVNFSHSPTDNPKRSFSTARQSLTHYQSRTCTVRQKWKWNLIPHCWRALKAGTSSVTQPMSFPLLLVLLNVFFLNVPLIFISSPQLLLLKQLLINYNLTSRHTPRNQQRHPRNS